MKFLLICIVIVISVFFAIKERRSKKLYIIAVCGVLSALLIGIAGDYIYDELFNRPNIVTPPPKPTDNGTTQPSSEPPEETDTTSDSKETQKAITKISLLKVDTFYSDGLVCYQDDIIDNEGSRYIGYAAMESGNFSPDYDGVAVYQNQNYGRVVGRVITKQKFRNSENCGWIRIYGDDELLFDSGLIHRGIGPKDFDVNVSQYREIKFEFKGGVLSTHETDTDYAYARCFLVDSYFYY